jgi:hypothetical protein
MDRAAHAAGLDLVVVSGFRSDAEQAVLFARHPDPKWVARPGQSRHRNATELDLDVSGGVYPWLVRHGNAFGFVQRYSWENWHWGFVAGCGAGQPGATAVAATALPAWVPARYRGVITASARAAGVTPVLLAALLEAESGFNPQAVSTAGAQGIAQFMPGTAAGMGVRDPFDPDQAIAGAARLIAAGLREFGSVPLALAFDGTAQTHAIKQNGFLRQEGHARALAKHQAHIRTGRIAQCAIDLFCSRRRKNDMGAGLRFDFNLGIIPTRHAARDIDEHRVKATCLFARESHAQSAFFAHVYAARDALNLCGAERHQTACADRGERIALALRIRLQCVSAHHRPSNRPRRPPSRLRRAPAR